MFQASGGSYKRKRNQPPTATSGKSGGPLPHSAELVLGHLDILRQTSKKYEFFNQVNYLLNVAITVGI